jgi:DNA invertase Pin-like site-specific DNA recombinase
MSRKKKVKRDQTKAIGYIRVSTRRQAEEGLSLDNQTQAIERYCALKGLEIAHIAVDPAVKGPRPLASRPAGAELVSRLGASEAGSVVALRLDRLFRGTLDCLQTAQEWTKQGISLHLIDLGGQAIDTSGAMGRLFLAFMAAFAELEHERISERSQETHDYLRREGKRQGRFAPYGYRFGPDDELVPHMREQDAIARIVKLKRERFSLDNIIRQLEDDGIEPRGKAWHRTTIVRILKAQLIDNIE